MLVVGDQNGRAPLALQDLPHLPGELLPQFGVHAGEGLVQQQDVRPRGHGPGQGDALLLAAGELMGILVPGAGHSDQLQQFRHPGLALAPAQVAQAKGDVARHAQVGEEGEVLEDHARPPRLRRQVQAGAGHLATVEVDLAAGDGFEAGHRPQQGGLAAAAGPQQAADVAPVQAEIHPRDDGHPAIGDTDVADHQ